MTWVSFVGRARLFHCILQRTLYPDSKTGLNRSFYTHASIRSGKWQMVCVCVCANVFRHYSSLRYLLAITLQRAISNVHRNNFIVCFTQFLSASFLPILRTESRRTTTTTDNNNNNSFGTFCLEPRIISTMHAIRMCNEVHFAAVTNGLTCQ